MEETRMQAITTSKCEAQAALRRAGFTRQSDGSYTLCVPGKPAAQPGMESPEADLAAEAAEATGAEVFVIRTDGGSLTSWTVVW